MLASWSWKNYEWMVLPSTSYVDMVIVCNKSRCKPVRQCLKFAMTLMTFSVKYLFKYRFDLVVFFHAGAQVHILAFFKHLSSDCLDG